MQSECKLYKAKVDIKTVDAFIGFLEDVGADKGVLITTTGFTSGAEKRAKAAGIDLNVMTLESAMETDWGEYLGDSCKTWVGCPGDINWDEACDGAPDGGAQDCGDCFKDLEERRRLRPRTTETANRLSV